MIYSKNFKIILKNINKQFSVEKKPAVSRKSVANANKFIAPIKNLKSFTPSINTRVRSTAKKIDVPAKTVASTRKSKQSIKQSSRSSNPLNRSGAPVVRIPTAISDASVNRRTMQTNRSMTHSSRPVTSSVRPTPSTGQPRTFNTQTASSVSRPSTSRYQSQIPSSRHSNRNSTQAEADPACDEFKSIFNNWKSKKSM